MTVEDAKRKPLRYYHKPVPKSESLYISKAVYDGEARIQDFLRSVNGIKKSSEYRVVTPCCQCHSCVVYRELCSGKLISESFYCKDLRSEVAELGTCNRAFSGKRGPMVIVKVLDEQGRSMPVTESGFPLPEDFRKGDGEEEQGGFTAEVLSETVLEKRQRRKMGEVEKSVLNRAEGVNKYGRPLEDGKKVEVESKEKGAKV